MYVCMCRPIAPFWSGIENGFEGTRGVYECIYRFNSKCGARKKQKYENSKWTEQFFCLRSNVSNKLI